MAGNDGTTPDHLAFLAQLAAAPARFDFFEAVRWLDCVFADGPRTGTAARPSEEHVHFGQRPSLAFAPGSLAAFEKATDEQVWRLQLTFFGMFGPNGALPISLTEYTYERRHLHRDETFARFVDIFHHRMAALFYRCWASSQPVVQIDRPATDRFAMYVGALLGIGVPSMRNRDAMPDYAKLHFAGHLGCQTRHPDGLRAILGSFFGMPARVEEFVGRWIPLPPECRLGLGRSPTTGTLADNAILGARIWDRQQNVRLELGPMTWRDYQRMLPGGSSLKRLAAIVRNYLGLELRWDVRLVLRQCEVPRIQLGRQGHLGWTTWALGRPAQRDADDLVLSRATENL